MKIGYFLSSEEWGPNDLVEIATKARDAGFRDLWISDHFHPWNHAQGHSPFVWATIGALSQAAPEMGVTTAVTCPMLRIHPAVIAQAAATAAVMLNGRFKLGVGTGEALNEHIFGDRWPEASERREMLDEAIGVIRELWQGGSYSHRGRHFRVEHAEIFDLPEQPPEIIISGFGERAIDLAARLGDGFCTTHADPSAVQRFRAGAQRGRLVQGGLKVCYDRDRDRALDTVSRLWRSDGLPGELAQILPTPSHFEQATELVTPEMLAQSVPCGPDLEEHLDAIRAYEDAGFDELYVQQIGPHMDTFFEVYGQQVLPQFA